MDENVDLSRRDLNGRGPNERGWTRRRGGHVGFVKADVLSGGESVSCSSADRGTAEGVCEDVIGR
jgi:hypothetical protein